MTEKQKLQIVILEHGYVEEATNWMNMFITPSLKGSVQEILESLAAAIIDGMYDRNPPIWKDCCTQAKESEKIPAFCPDCGSRLKRPDLELDDYRNIAWGYLNGHCDGTTDAWDKLEQADWHTLGSAVNQLGGETTYPVQHPFQNNPTFIYVHEYGATLLAAAYTKKLLAKDKRDKDNYNYDWKLEKHVQIFGGGAKDLKIFKEEN